VLVDEDAHFFFLFTAAFFALRAGAFFFTGLRLGLGFGLGFGLGLGFACFLLIAATTRSPACAMLSAEMIGRPESLRILLPRSSLVPEHEYRSDYCPPDQ
jgi:hypothetical protein